MSASGTPITGVVGTSIGAQTSQVAVGSTVVSADVNVPVQAIENDIATISTGNVTLGGTKTFSGQIIASASPVLAQAGATVSGGALTVAQAQNLTAGGTGSNMAGNWTMASGGVTMASGTTLGLASGAIFSALYGSDMYMAGRTVRRATANLLHSGTIHTATFVDVATANDWIYLGGATAPSNNYLKIREGTSTANGGIHIGDWIRFTMGPSAPGGQLYTVFREDGTTALAELWGAGQWLELAWDGSKWRYVTSSPWVPTGTAIPGNAAYYGDGSSGTNGVVLYPVNL